MSQVRAIDPCTDRRWDQFVEDHPFGWLTHLSGWKEVMARSFPHVKPHYLALFEEDRIVAGLPLFEVRSWLTGNKLVSIPFATLCDALVSDPQQFRILLEESLVLMKKSHASFVEVRTLSSTDMIQDERLGVHRYYQHHYLHLNGDPENLKKSFHRTCVRQKIQRARICGLKVRVAESDQDLEVFFDLYLMTRRRLGLPTQPYSFFQAIWDVYFPSGMLELLIAEHEERPIAGLINFKFKDRVSAEFAASDAAALHMSPNHLLFWETIRMACRDGFKIFDFGRTNPTNHDLMDFKRRWGSEVIELAHFYYPKEVCEKINGKENTLKFKLAKTMCIKSPDSMFEPLGKFLYRHI
jgi:CelD/BcsL family acetyltransferase involved in cellulose biosynthesis